MNARSIKKRVMKNRRLTFWGRRSLVTVRLPLALFPPPPPDYPTPSSLYPGRAQTAEEGGWKETFRGHWFRTVPISSLPAEEQADFDPGDEDQWVQESWSISQLHGGPDPRLAYPDGKHGMADRHIIVTDTWEDANGVTRNSFKWWEGVFLSQVTPEKNSVLSRDKSQDFAIDPEIIDQFIARREWEDKYLVGMDGDTGHEVIDSFLAAAEHAKTTYHRVTDRFVYLTYSIKWFYMDEKLRFCADLKHAFDVARKNGIQVKVS